MENVVKNKRKRNITVTVVKNAKIKRMRSNAHLKKKSVENALSYKSPSVTIITDEGFCFTIHFSNCNYGNKSLFFRKKK